MGLSVFSSGMLNKYIVRLLVATLYMYVGMTGFQDGGYTQLVQLQQD